MTRKPPPAWFPTLRNYRAGWLTTDLLAGLTFCAVAVPGQLATASLAGMPPATGLIGFLAGAIAVAALSTNPRLTIYSDSTIAPLLAAGVLGVAAPQTAEYVHAAVMTTVMVGVMVLIVGIAKLGSISEYLSKAVVTGFLGGIALVIFIHELPSVLGLPPVSGGALGELWQVIGNLGQVSWLTTGMSVVSLAILLGAARIDGRIPAALIVLVGSIVLSDVLDLSEHGVKVMGAFPDRPPVLSLPGEPISMVLDLLPTAVAIAIVALMQTAGTTRVAAEDGRFTTDMNADMRALGAGNVLSGLFGGFTVDGSPPTTSLMSQMRAKSQMASLFAGALVLVLLLFAERVLEALPSAILGVVLIYISARIFDVREMNSIRRFSASSFITVVVTIAGVLVLGVGGGLVLAFILDIGNRARRDSRPQLDRLMQNDKGRWRPVRGPMAEEPSLVTVYRVNGPLWFANASWVRNHVLDTVHHKGEPGRLLVLDMEGVEDVDYTAAQMLERLIVSCGNRRTTLAIVGNKHRLIQLMSGSSFMADLGKGHVFRSINKAVAAFGPGRGGTHPAIDDVEAENDEDDDDVGNRPWDGVLPNPSPSVDEAAAVAPGDAAPTAAPPAISPGGDPGDPSRPSSPPSQP